MLSEWLQSLQGRKSPYDEELFALLTSYGINCVPHIVIAREEQLNSLPFSYPIVLKISAYGLLHRTDIGGVYLNIQNAAQARACFRQLREKFHAAKILAEPFLKGGLELIMGLVNDATFGPTILFGVGGIFTEIYRDVSFRAVPITRSDAECMLSEFKAAPLLRGYRGISINRESVIAALLALSRLGAELGLKLDQLDLNPVLADENTVTVLDAKLLLR